MVGLGKIDELKVKRKRASKQNGALGGKRVYQFQRGSGVTSGLVLAVAGFGVAPSDGALAQRLNVGEQVVPGLLTQHIAEQRAERTHVAAQRSFFQVAGLGFKFSQSLRPTLGVPQEG